MSDVPPGPGWWIASDGRWYPPEAHPGAAPPWAAPPPGSSYPPPAAGAQTVPAPGAWGGPPPDPWGAPPPGWGPNPGYGYPPPTYGYAPRPMLHDRVLGLPLAPWWKRLLAILIDDVILFIPLVVALAVVFDHVLHTLQFGSSEFNSGVSTNAGTLGHDNLILWSLAFVIEVAYFGLLNGGRRGQTVGKMALKIAVRDERTGGPIGVWRAAGRFACFAIFEIPFEGPLAFLRLLSLLYLIDCLAPLWDGRRQAWHDHVVHSVVVELPG
jgi:uncharacterized RDD family membrane protein YckC